MAALALISPFALGLATVPAQAAQAVPTLEIRKLHVDSDHGLSPGSTLRFRLEGSPSGRASIRIRGVRETVRLRETARGVYTGRHVVAHRDRIDASDKLHAQLRRGNRTAISSYDIPESLRQASAPPEPAIERFTVTAQGSFEPGAELRFLVEGLPGAKVSVAVPGSTARLSLREVRPGHYEASYTVRRADDPRAHGPVIATMRLGERVAVSHLAQWPPAATAGPP